MIIAPKVRGFICTTAHPAGCAANVEQQIAYVQHKNANNPNKLNHKINNALIIGSSTGYGLASRIVASFIYKAKTIGIMFERSALAEKTASAGWYNTAAFEKHATNQGLYAKSINGDAFSIATKEQTIDLINKDWANQKKIDLIVYSIASPRRVDPKSNVVYNSVLKPINNSYKDRTIDVNTGKISTIEIAPATPEEIEATIKVMGGEDLQLWVDYLHNAGLLATNCKIIGYSYIGPTITYPIYRDGTIGRAKEHLEKTVKNINDFLTTNYNGNAFISVNKALVTQASSAIPVVPLYMSLLYKIMKNKNIHEGCIEQIYRLFNEHLYTNNPISLDAQGRIRIDDLEMREDVQQEIYKLWNESISTENIETIADLHGYRDDFYKLFGFNIPQIDYNKDYNIDLPINSLLEYAE